MPYQSIHHFGTSPLCQKLPIQEKKKRRKVYFVCECRTSYGMVPHLVMGDDQVHVTTTSTLGIAV